MTVELVESNVDANINNYTVLQQAQAPQITKSEQIKVLLDECVMCNLSDKIITETNYEFHTSSKIIGKGATDDKVIQIAQENNFDLVVTKDHELVAHCIIRNIPVAYSVAGKAHILKPEYVFDRHSIPLVFVGESKTIVVRPISAIELPVRIANGAPIKVQLPPQIPTKQTSLFSKFWATLRRIMGEKKN